MKKAPGMDLSKFKHVKSDDKSTVLQHKDGHQLIISHKSLSKDMQTQLSALAGVSKDAETPMQADQMEHKAAPMAEGGPVLQEDPNSPDIVNKLSQVDVTPGPVPTELTRAQQIYNKLTQTPFESGEADFRSMPTGKEPITPGGNPSSFDPMMAQKAQQIATQEQADNAAQIQAQQQKVIQENMARASMGLPAAPVPNAPAGPQPPGSMDPQAQGIQPADLANAPKSPTEGMASGMQDMEGMLHSGYSNQIAGINAQAQAQGDLGKQQAEVLAQAQQAQTDAKAAYQQHYDELNQERMHLVKDVQDGQVDPEKFWDNHSKLASGIGMILAGFNPTNSPNAAINYLEHQMDRNIDAQKANLATKRSLLTANMEQFHNLKDATEMTRLQQADLVTNQLQQAAAKASSPLAKAAALQAAGQLQEKYAPMFQQFAMRRALMGLANGGNGSPQAVDHLLGYMRVVNPEMAKEMEGRYVPGVGLGSVPVPAEARQQIISGQKLTDAASDLLKYSKMHTNLNPASAEYKVGQQKAMILQQMVREGMLGTVFRESEKPLLSKFVDDNPAGAFKTISSDPKIRTILQATQAQMNTLKSNYGLPQQAPPPEYKTVNGIKYMRGPDGKAVRVK